MTEPASDPSSASAIFPATNAPANGWRAWARRRSRTRSSWPCFCAPASAGSSALDRARRILATRGGLSGLAGASAAELASRTGHQVAPAPRRSRPRSRSRGVFRPRRSIGRDLLNEPRLVKEYPAPSSQADDAQERTGALFLNARNRLLKDDPEIYRGTLDRAVVEPREILKRALIGHAAA